MFLSVIDEITKFFNDNLVLTIIIDAYLALLVISFVIFLCIKFKKAINLTIIGILLIAIKFAADQFGFKNFVDELIRDYIKTLSPQDNKNKNGKNNSIVLNPENDKNKKNKKNKKCCN